MDVCKYFIKNIQSTTSKQFTLGTNTFYNARHKFTILTAQNKYLTKGLLLLQLK